MFFFFSTFHPHILIFILPFRFLYDNFLFSLFFTSSFQLLKQLKMGCIGSQELQYKVPPLQRQSCTQYTKHKLTGISNSTKQSKSQKQKNLNDIEKITQLKQSISGQALILVQKAVSRHFLFYGLNQNERHDLIRLMKRYIIQKDEYVFRRGDPATTFFVIINGKVEVEVGLEQPKLLQKGEVFGDLALIYQTVRSFSVVARNHTVCWGLQSIIFNMYMNQLKQRNAKLTRSFIERVSFFSYLSAHQKQNIAVNSLRLQFKAGTKIFCKDDPANSIFIVIGGRIQMRDIPGKPQISFEQGDMFGQGCLIGHEFRYGTAECVVDTQCLSISKNLLLKELQVRPDNILFYCICKWALKRSAIFNLLKRSIIDKIICSGQIKLVQSGQIIECVGSPTQSMFICLQGKINNSGVGAIFNEKLQHSGLQNLIKQETGYIFCIKFQTLTRIVSRPLKRLIHNKQKKVKFVTQHIGNIDDLKVLSTIKKSYYSQILQATTYSKPNCKYIVHCFKKNIIIGSQKYEKVHDYIKTLIKVSHHPLIPKICKLFTKDPHYLFLVKEFVGSSTLTQGLQHLHLTEDSAKFYIACILEIVKHLHQMNVVHGRIYPDAFIIGENGYLYANQMPQVLDLSIGQKTNYIRTNSLTHSPHYLSPEVIKGQLPTKQSDLWSIGVLIHSIIYGRLPFQSESNSPFQIYLKILQKRSEEQELLCTTQCWSSLPIIINSLLKLHKQERMQLTEIQKLLQVNLENIRKFKEKIPQRQTKAINQMEIETDVNVFPKKEAMSSLNQYFSSQRKLLGQSQASNKNYNWTFVQE